MKIRPVLLGGIALAISLIMAAATACSSNAGTTSKPAQQENQPQAGGPQQGTLPASAPSGQQPVSTSNSATSSPGATTLAGAMPGQPVGRGTSGTIASVESGSINITTNENQTV